jgi:sugar transferase EpsL
MLKFVSRCKPYNNRIKRLFDLIIAVPSVVILLPLLVLIGILVRLKIGSPVLLPAGAPRALQQAFYHL